MLVLTAAAAWAGERHSFSAMTDPSTMKPAVITLIILALLLTGLGVYGVIDFLQSSSSEKEIEKLGNPREGTVARGLKDLLESMDRSRTTALLVSLLCLGGGLGLGAWACWRYFHPQAVGGG